MDGWLDVCVGCLLVSRRPAGPLAWLYRPYTAGLVGSFVLLIVLFWVDLMMRWMALRICEMDGWLGVCVGCLLVDDLLGLWRGFIARKLGLSGVLFFFVFFLVVVNVGWVVW